MAGIEQIQELLTEIGPDLRAQAVLDVGNGRWAIVYDEQTIVEISHQPERNCLTIEIELGAPEPEKQADTHQAMLIYAGLGEVTGGVRIALDAPGGSLIQLLDLFTDELDRATLIRVLDGFVEKTLAFRTLLADGGVSVGEIAVDDKHVELPSGLRV